MTLSSSRLELQTFDRHAQGFFGKKGRIVWSGSSSSLIRHRRHKTRGVEKPHCFLPTIDLVCCCCFPWSMLLDPQRPKRHWDSQGTLRVVSKVSPIEVVVLEASRDARRHRWLFLLLLLSDDEPV
eukprot:scaffold1791_cov56-Cylindrotheca_fusiformis.AAC.1